VSVNNVHVSGTILAGGAEAGGDFTLTSANALTVAGSVTTDDGSIALTGGGALLTIANDADVLANNGGIVIANINTANGAVLIDDNATVVTDGKGDDVIIAIGPPPKKGTNPIGPVPPPGINPDIQGKGNIFLGPVNGIDVPSGTSNVNAINKAVIFNNLSGNIGTFKITLGDNTTITADPPAKVASRFMPTFSTPSIESPVIRSSSSSLAAFNTVDARFNTAQAGLNDASFVGLTTSNVFGTATGFGITTSDDGMTADLSTATGLSTALGLDTAPGTASGTSFQNGPITVHENVTSDLTIDAILHSEKQEGQKKFVTEGNFVFAPTADTTVETPHGTLKLKAGSIALVMKVSEGLAVYNMHDQSKNAVVVTVGQKQLSLSPGRHVLIGNHAQNDYANANPLELVLHRGLKQSKLENGWTVYSSEFSIPSACYAVKPLTKLMKSTQPEARQLAKRLMKTTAVIMAISPDRGDYVQFFKRRMTANASR
jgi:hypothetical protein